ncbi:hypothetical protein GBA52_021639 [Prunus armeniaca]|nr:hypothetical protein GBA52_021639 [Prunus armeniaca]
MCSVTRDDVTQFIQMINSFFTAHQVPIELALFLNYLEGNYNNLQMLFKHPVLLTAQERMKYRLNALEGINKDPLLKRGMEIELSNIVPNMADWITNVVNQHFNSTILTPYYNILYYFEMRMGLPVTPYVPKKYQNTALSFLQYNRNTGAHPPSTDEEADAVLNGFMPSFLAHLFEALDRRGLYF